MKTSINRFIQKVIENLELQSQKIAETAMVSQTSIQKEQGYITINGIIVPLYSVRHRLLVDNFHIVFLTATLDLYKKIFQRKFNVFTGFALRTCMEMCIDRARIIFDQDIFTQEEKRLFILFLMLDDYAFMSISNPKNFDYYKKLLAEERILLKGYEKLFDAITLSIESKDLETLHKKVVNLRMDINRMQKKLLLKTRLPIIFDKTRLNAVQSSFSHILHGNVFLLINLLLEEKSKRRRLFHLYAALLFSGGTLINTLERYLNVQGKNVIDLEKFNQELQLSYRRLGENYKTQTHN